MHVSCNVLCAATTRPTSQARIDSVVIGSLGTPDRRDQGPLEICLPDGEDELLARPKEFESLKLMIGLVRLEFLAVHEAVVA